MQDNGSLCARDDEGDFALGRLATAFGGSVNARGCDYEPSVNVGEIVIDSRVVKKGDVFVALRGNNTDGEMYVVEALDRGAVAVLCRYGGAERVGRDGIYIEVDDPLTAVYSAAARIRRNSGFRVVGVTGSVGKTTVKELCISVLSTRYPTDGTRGNNNNALGLSLSVINAFFAPRYEETRGKPPKNEQRYLVLEMGISRKGEMEELARIAAPSVALITNIGSMHGGYLGGRAGIIAEKSRIASLGAERVICPNDEDLLCSVSEYIPRERIITLGFESGSDAVIRSLGAEGRNGFGEFNIHARFSEEKKTVYGDFTSPIVGEHGVYDSAVASLVGLISGISSTDINAGLRRYVPVAMRQEVKIVGETVRIVDCYNSGPESLRAALSAMKEYSATYRCRRRVAVLGDMLELGECSRMEHFKIGSELASFGVDVLFAIGDDAAFTADGAIKGGLDKSNVFLYSVKTDFELIKADIELKLRPEDIILYKGSRGIGLERLL